MLVPIWLWINGRPTLSLPRPIYQNQQLGHMMIKHPDSSGLLGPKFQLCCRLQLYLIACLSLGCEMKKGQLHHQDPLVCEVTRAAESGMSYILCVYVWRRLVVHFIKINPLRFSWPFLRLAAVSPVWFKRLDNSWWVGTVGEALTGRLLIKEELQCHAVWGKFFAALAIVSIGNNITGVCKWIVSL